jgi:sec-independent protein translocase protein TatB
VFEVGFTELLLIFALALIVLGPERLPRVASQVGRWIGRARAMARQFREQLEEEAIPDPTEPPPRQSRRRPRDSNTTTPTAPAAPPTAANPAGNFVPGEDDFRHNDTSDEPKAPDERGP